MNYLKSVRMDDHSILMAVTALISAIGLKEVWSIWKKKMDIGVTKSERKFSVYSQNIEALTNKITELEAKIEVLISENTQLLVKVARMEEKLILNAKRRVKSKIKKDEKS
jgi:predicted RNase H-like nuclease (RuvC/YqgF family)|tara:strand:+ start:670 stop:999 length:330 start_codon:yes stop_codon:yes gene_type:complete